MVTPDLGRSFAFTDRLTCWCDPFYKLRGKPLLKAMITGKQTQMNKQALITEQKIVYLAPQSRALGVLVAATLVTMAIVALS